MSDEQFGRTGPVALELAYGENRDQSPAFLHTTGTDDPLAWDKFQLVPGSTVPGYINMADGDRALQVLCLLVEAFRKNYLGLPWIAIACKHGNPCGAAVEGESPAETVRKAMLGDPLAVMGGEVMTNFPVTDEVGQETFRVPEELQGRVGRKFWGVDVVFAPEFSAASVELFTKREGGRRLLANPALAHPAMPPDEWALRPVRGGFLRQRAPRYILGDDPLEYGKIPGLLGYGFLPNLILAWAIAWRASSNTVVLVKDGMLIGAGVGQQDRVACVQLALDRARRAGHDPNGSVFASDAFFPYAKRSSDDVPLEGPELLDKAGCMGGVVPADGKNLEEVRAFFRERDMHVAFVPKEHRGFSQH